MTLQSCYRAYGLIIAMLLLNYMIQLIIIFFPLAQQRDYRA